MAYDQILAERIQAILSRRQGITEKKMFGGLAFLLHGNMLVGVWKESMIVRLAPGADLDAMSQPGVRPMDVTGKPMKGWILVDPPGLDDERLAYWIDEAMHFVRTLPRK